MKLRLLIAVVPLAVLTACAQAPKAPVSNGKSAALRTMEQVAIAAHKCWFASRDPAFAKYRFANELNSMSGQPRFLLVPAGNYGGLPLLVVQARGSSSALETFGPILSQPLGTRISADLSRWKAGDQSCSARA